MRICKYMVVVLSIAFNFPGIGMENSYLGRGDDPHAKPLKIIITNLDLDEDDCYFKPLHATGKKEITTYVSNNCEAVFEIENVKSCPFGLSVFGDCSKALINPQEEERVSAFLPKRGHSVEMIYYGERSKFVVIRLFRMNEIWQIYQPSIKDYCSGLERALQTLGIPDLPAQGPTVHASQIRVSLKGNSCAGLVFYGNTCPSSSCEMIFMDCFLFHKIEDCKNISGIEILLRKSEQGFKAEVSTQMHEDG